MVTIPVRRVSRRVSGVGQLLILIALFFFFYFFFFGLYLPVVVDPLRDNI